MTESLGFRTKNTEAGICPLLWLLGAALLAAGASAPVQAEDLGALTLEVALDLAAKHNPDLELSSAGVKFAEVEVESARAAYLPAVSAGLSTSHTQQKGRSSSTLLEGAGQDDSFEGITTADADISGSWAVFSGFGRAATVDYTEQSLSATRSTHLRTEESVAFETAARFLEVATARALIDAAEENLAGQRQQLTRIDAFYTAGARPVSDLYQQQASTSQAEFTLLQARRDLAVSRLELLAMMGQPLTDTFEIVPPELDRLLTESTEPDLEAALADAMEHRADLRAQRSDLQAAEAQVRAARAGRWPSVNATAGLGTGYTATSTDSTGTTWGDGTPYARLGLSMTIPILDQRKTSTNVSQALINVRRQETTLTDLVRTVSLALGQALEDRRTAALQVEVAASQLTWAARALEATEARYNNGAETLVTLIQARATCLEARYTEIKARYGLALQELTVAYHTGKLETALARLNAE